MNHPLRVVVLISGNGSNLQALIEKQKSFNFSIVAVISNRADAFGLSRASSAGIATHTLGHNYYPNRASFDKAMIEIIDDIQAELIVLAGFMRILTPEFTRHYTGRLINIHPSLLPAYKGLNTHKRVLEAKEKQHGTTVHFVTAELDDGATIIQAPIQIQPDDTVTSLQQRIQALEHIIYPLTINWIASDRLHYKYCQAWLENKLLPEEGYQYCTRHSPENSSIL